MLKKCKLTFTLAVAVLVALTVCGSVWDYEIAEALYCGQGAKENLFGVIFAFVGVIPTFVGWSFFGASIWYLSKTKITDEKKKKWLMSLSVLLFTLSFFYFCNTLMLVNQGAFNVRWWIAYPVGILVITGAGYLGYSLSRKNVSAELLEKILFLAAVSLVMLVFVSLIKRTMERPRFRFVLDMGNHDYFRNWWQSGRDIKSSLPKDAVSDNFTSFPSGHSAYSMFAVFVFPLISDFIPKLEKYRNVFFALGFLWWELTAVSRLTVGAHYLSDVSIAGLIVILAYGITALVKWFDVSRAKKKIQQFKLISQYM